MGDIRSYLSSIYQRMVNGDSVYFANENFSDRYGLTGTDLSIAQNHPILTPAILFMSKIFSQGEFYLKNEKTDTIIKNHPYLNLIKDPNFYQTTIDFLESLYFMMIAQGVVVVYKKKSPGGMHNSMYVINKDLIKWPEGYNTKLSSRKVLEKDNTEIIYDEAGDNITIRIKDLLFFYDTPNTLNKNFFTVKSRISGLRQTLENTNDSLIAKNIILKTNGKELISGKAGSFPLDPEEKKRIENIYQASYGLSKTRRRAIITRSDVTHKSLHIALRDLGLDESVKTDGNIIYTALHIPKDILSLEAKKTTYNNFKESMVSFIQNEIQGSLDYVLSVMTRDLKETYPDLKLIGNYEHLPVMQFVLLEKYKVVKTRAEALLSLRKAGLPDDVCLEACGLDTSIKLTKIKDGTNNTGKPTPKNKNKKIK